MTQSPMLNQLYSQQLFEDRLRDAEQIRLVRSAEGKRKGTAWIGLGRLRELLESVRLTAVRPSPAAR